MNNILISEDEKILTSLSDLSTTTSVINTDKVYTAPILKKVSLQDKPISTKPVLDENLKPLF